MSWVLDDAHDIRCEGWVAYITNDGETAAFADRRGLVLAFDDHDEHRDTVAPWAALVGWEARCTCGWTGPMWRRLNQTDQHPDEHALGPELDNITAEDAIHDAWLTHARHMGRKRP